LSHQKQTLKITREDGFLDLNFGNWEGKNYNQVQKEYPEIYNTWVRNPHLVNIPGGEALADAKKRSFRSVNNILKEHKEKQGLQTFAVVSHRVINKLLINSILGLDESKFWQIKQDPCCINIFEYRYENFFVSLINYSFHINSPYESINIMDF